MSNATEAAAIRSRFSTEWSDTTPIAWPNVSYTPTPGTAWVRLTILPADASQVELGAVGSRRFRHAGVIVVQVFVPENTGDGTVQTLAAQAAAVFRGVTVGEIRYGAPRVRTVGNDGAGWYQVNVECPYSRDTDF